MVKAWQTLIVLLGVCVVAQPLFNVPVEAQLTPNFYSTSCPSVFSIVAKGVHTAIQNQTRNAASLLRLHFHDCFVQGCDASVLLVNTSADPSTSEQFAAPNNNSLRGFDVIASIKASVESSCPGVVSCADILTLAAYFSVVLSGGPAWEVPLGRRDSFLANVSDTVNLPNPSANITTLKKSFAFQNLSDTDLVALSGGHTIGLARCALVTKRLYHFGATGGSDPTINKTLLISLEKSCPNNGVSNVTVPIEISTPAAFDNLYYKNLLLSNGLFQSDQELYTSAADTKALVQLYANNQTKFFDQFATSMIKMGNLNVLTGKAGEVRKVCSVRNHPVSSIIDEVVDSDAEQGNEKSETVKETAGTLELFKQIVKKAVDEIIGEELEKLVEETVTGGHSSI